MLFLCVIVSLFWFSGEDFLLVFCLFVFVVDGRGVVYVVDWFCCCFVCLFVVVFWGDIILIL